jgi:hypothetical protein
MYLSIPTQTFTMHVIIVFGLIIAFCFFFGLYPKWRKKAPVEPVLWTIGDYFNHLNRRIHAVTGFDELKELESLINGFYYRQYVTKPDACLRRALQKSLRGTFNSKYSELQKVA